MISNNDKYYIGVGRSADLEDKKDRFIYRLLEFLPGFSVWLTLTAMVLVSWLRPIWAAVFIIAFCFYWLLRTAYFLLHLVASYKKMKINLRVDWKKELETLSKKYPDKDWRKIYHLVVLPMYKENWEIVRESFKALIKSDYPKNKIIVVLAVEERAGEAGKFVAQKIADEFSSELRRFLITRHPQNVPGEIAGKGSNETWAGKIAKKEIIDRLGIPYEDVIVSCLDVDTQVFPRYFSCLTWHYLTAKNPFRSSFQPIPLYLNNLWEAPFFSRVISSANVFWQMIQQQRPEEIVTYSSHAMSFKALVEMDFWQTNVVSEDAGIFWKSYLFYDSDYRVVPLHYPVSMDSCAAESFWRTVVNQYKQQRRWAWGSEGIPYLIFGFLKNNKIPLRKKFRYPILIIEGFWAWATNPLLILFLGWLPILLGGEQFRSSLLAHNLPQTTQALMILATIGMITGVIISTLLLTPRPAWCPRWKSFSMFTQWAFFPLSFIIFGSLPAIDAQTRLMLGRYMGFWITEKKRRFPKK